MKGTIRKKKSLRAFWIEAENGKKYHLKSEFNRLSNLDEDVLAYEYEGAIVNFEIAEEFGTEKDFGMKQYDGAANPSSIVINS